MARQCDVCGKSAQLGNQVTIRGKQKYLGGVGTKITGISRRKFKPNLQRVHVTTSSGTNKAMALTRADVEKVALLARLQLTDAELETMTGQLAQIVGYVDQLAEVNTEGVEPMAHAVELTNVFAEDRVEPSLPRAAALANA